jgi:hypothetical protein
LTSQIGGCVDATNEEAMHNRRETDRSPVGSLRTLVGWLLVLLVASGGVVLAIFHLGLWLVFAAGALATFAIVALLRPGADAASTSFARHAESGWGYLRTELARSRRHDRRFAVVGVPEEVWTPDDAATKVEHGLDVAAAVQGLVRRPDRAWVDGARLHILLTDCDRPKGLAFLARARGAMPQLFADDRVKLVVFPDDGITSGALLSGLEADEVPAVEPEPTGGMAQ